jgi:hypothetical protein
LQKKDGSMCGALPKEKGSMCAALARPGETVLKLEEKKMYRALKS